MADQVATLHTLAQQLNKDGRFEEATKVYKQMNALSNTVIVPPPKSQPNSGPVMLPLLWKNSPLIQHQPDEGQIIVNQDKQALRKRAINCVLGWAVGDAASMGLHWVYDLEKLESLVAARNPAVPEFMDPSANFFYQYASGEFSVYGDQTHALLRSMAECGGLNVEHYAASSYAHFAEKRESPLYMDVSTKGFMANYTAGMRPPESGADDSQANCIARLPPVVAAFAGDNNALLRAVEDMVRVTQNTSEAVAWGCAGARLLQSIVLGASPAKAVVATIAALRDTQRVRPMALDEDIANKLEEALLMSREGGTYAAAAASFGRNCHLPGALQGPVFLLSRLSQVTDADFIAVIRDIILQGGCNASRAGFTGACLGASADTIPQEWVAKTNHAQEVLHMATAFVELRE
eukprot:jgi/Chlat1/9282/Chrsp99S08544